MNAKRLSSLRVALASVATMVALVVAPSEASATYRYTYTSQQFDVETFSIDVGTGDKQTAHGPGRVVAIVDSPTLLTAGLDGSVGLPAGISFSLTAFGPTIFGPGRFSTTLTCPALQPGVDGNCIPFVDPNFIPHGAFEITSVDATSLPTGWNINIGTFFFPHSDTGFETSTHLDSIGNDERFAGYSGSIADAPGVWTLAVVAEPETYALMMGGVGLLGALARRRKSVA